jgi:LDH2 family malate/lactate/ureidoglycolate dehydrogenase
MSHGSSVVYLTAMTREACQQPADEPDAEVLVPGDPEYRTQRIRAVEGIPIEPGLQEEPGLNGEWRP